MRARQVDDAYRALSRLDRPESHVRWTEVSGAVSRGLGRVSSGPREDAPIGGGEGELQSVPADQGKLGRQDREIDEAAKAWLRQLDKNVAEILAAKDIQRLVVAEKNRQALYRLQVIALDLHRQLTQQVFAANDEEMESLAEQIAVWLKEVDARLAELGSQSDVQDAPRLDALGGAFRALGPLVTQMQKLLQANTKSRAEEISRLRTDTSTIACRLWRSSPATSTVNCRET